MSKRVLITGISGGLAQIVGEMLAAKGCDVVGVDYRPVDNSLEWITRVYQANYNKTRIEDIFRRHAPQWVLHLGRVGNLKERASKRFDLNVVGSKKVMELSLRHGASRLVVLSTFHIYGAHPHNHIPIYEDEPLRAGTQFPQIADAIQLDGQAVAWVYQHPELKTTLLRPCHVVGGRIGNAISRFLRNRTVPVPAGFDPMMQFVHQSDLAAAVITAAESDVSGVFNVAGSGSIPWRTALDVVGARQIPIPSSLGLTYLKLRGMVRSTFPPYLINFFKYPCIVSDEAIRTSLGWQPKVSQAQALRETIGLSA